MKLGQRNAQCGFTLIEFTVVIAVLVVLAAMLLPGMTGNKAKPERITCTNNLRLAGLAFHQWALDHNDKLPTEVSVTNGGAMEAVLAGDVAMVFRVLSNQISTPKILFCPTDQRRIQANTFDNVPVKRSRRDVPFVGNSNVTYFVGLDTNPSSFQMCLTGDDNLLVGGQAGYYGGLNGAPVKPGLLSLWTNTPVAWADSRHGKQGNVGLADGSVQWFSSRKLAEALRNTGVATNRLAFP
jgi:prepilin-type N-terminal cleavage/methylation domain-containing protein/prepilin-type processing-associated H-X9-DG protein